ncbi:MAG: hypothetical protein GQ582_10465 [Methyloprofundus sp.]|nr:hypothetical protein [Methyloprofundus sp.]
MNTFKKLAVSSLLLTGLTLPSLAMAESSFDGHEMNVKFEGWILDGNDIDEVAFVRNEVTVTASDSESPDAEGFHAMDENFNIWDIDFNKQEIEMVFTSIEIQDHDNQYMYMTPVGFHFEDADGSLPEILDVEVDDEFAPSSFNKDLVSFDADNIYVSLQGSMCHIAGMGGMPECTNDDSPTGYSNIIKVKVTFADDMSNMDNEENHEYDMADRVFDWIESEYAEFFPGNQESFDLEGYYVRYYPETELYMGVLDGKLYGYGDLFGGLLDAGELSTWLEDVPVDSNGCYEDQHFMSDMGECMDNDAMHDHSM